MRVYFKRWDITFVTRRILVQVGLGCFYWDRYICWLALFKPDEQFDMGYSLYRNWCFPARRR